MPLVRAGAIQDKSDLHGSSALARFDPEQKFSVPEPFPILIPQDAIDAVTEAKAHSRGDEHVLEAVGVQVTDADTPGPEGLRSDPVGDFFEAALSMVYVEHIPENIIGCALE